MCVCVCVCVWCVCVCGVCVCVRVDESLCSVGKLGQWDSTPSLERRDTVCTVDSKFGDVTGHAHARDL